MPPKQAALARQVRQRMNRLCKPEHRARFCFFSKKKSRAGMRRFPIPSEIQIRMGFNRSAANPRSPKTILQPSPLVGAKRHHARWNYHRTTPAMLARRMALAPPHPLKPPHLPPASHHRSPWRRPYARMRRARAGFQSAARYSKSMPRSPPGGCKRKRRPNRRLWRGKCGKG